MAETAIRSTWVSGNLVFYEDAVGQSATGDVLTLGTAAVKIGGTAQDIDFQFYGTGSISAIIDCGAATFTLTGIALKTNTAPTPIANDGAALGSATLSFSDLFLASGAVINFNNGDVTLTHASNALNFAGGCLNLFASGSEYAFTAGTPAFTMYTTNASTSGSTSAESFLVYNTQTGVGGVGGRAKFYTTANVALGGWANALKAQFDYGASGRITGLGSAFCAELTLSAGCTQGTYAVLELELNMGASGVTGTATSLAHMSVNDNAKSVFDDYGYIFNIQGLTSGSAHCFYANKSVPFDAFLGILIGTTPYWIGLTAQRAAAS